MSDFKSKLPNLQEITSFASKLFKDVKNSVGEIVDEYKKHREEAAEEARKTEETEIVSSKTETEVVAKKTEKAPADEQSADKKS
ncbi:hypothetical protein Lbir_2565 [Legionella birminghamensis]|uniref:Uncharacterized protein n=1 Tax=Legionella birminghamensis TaxID=28083 RepID=A0A378I7X1_9GAMM|nr:hypothetical protein [Legionella birminghamensis]KTC67963.1 hypothetical protein Lbir_2565 [Legionella birminghamensis]STX31328.1 Uncharacterised protein [Legionella birminghamensis]